MYQILSRIPPFAQAWILKFWIQKMRISKFRPQKFEVSTPPRWSSKPLPAQYIRGSGSGIKCPRTRGWVWKLQYLVGAPASPPPLGCLALQGWGRWRHEIFGNWPNMGPHRYCMVDAIPTEQPPKIRSANLKVASNARLWGAQGLGVRIPPCAREWALTFLFWWLESSPSWRIRPKGEALNFWGEKFSKFFEILKFWYLTLIARALGVWSHLCSWHSSNHAITIEPLFPFSQYKIISKSLIRPNEPMGALV